jgi:hypothetical protein
MRLDRMIRPGFLDAESRKDLTELARDGSAAHRLARRANALVLLDDGMGYAAVAKVLLIDDDTVRTWHGSMQPCGVYYAADEIGSLAFAARKPR